MNKKKLLVTGAQGFVAGSVLAQAGPEWEVHALSRGPEPRTQNFLALKARVGEGRDSPRWHWHQCEVLSRHQLIELFLRLRPDSVIHPAALADIDFCEKHPESAIAVNVELTRSLAEACAQTGGRLVFCSTDTVFDGEHAPYAETAQPGPVNCYARTKVEAEQIVTQLGKHGVIARLALVFGLPVLGGGNSFLLRLRAALETGRTVVVPEQEVRTPVDVLTVGQALLELAWVDHHGFFHLAGLRGLNRLELTRRLAGRFGFSEQLVMAQPAGAIPDRAVRPRDVSLSVARTQAELKTPMKTFEEGLETIMANS